MFRAPDPVLHVDADAVARNVAFVRERAAGETLLAVVKDDGYGHGSTTMARALAAAGIDRFCTAGVHEALRLLDAGIPGTVMNIRPFGREQAVAIAERGIVQSVYTDEQVAALVAAASKTGRPVRVQVKVDTGMRRFGVGHEAAPDFIRKVAGTDGLEMVGVMSTLTEDHDFDRIQIDRFRGVREAVGSAGDAWIWHLRSSNGLLHHPDVRFGTVRVGSLLHGFPPSGEGDLPLSPVARLSAPTIDLRTYESGERLGYRSGPRFERPTRVAFLGIGTHHGLDDALSGKGEAILSGRRQPIVALGAEYIGVALDDDIEVALGDSGVLLGSQGNASIDVLDWSAWTGDPVYRILYRLHPVLRRDASDTSRTTSGGV